MTPVPTQPIRVFPGANSNPMADSNDECLIRFAFAASSPSRALPGTIEILSEIGPCQ